MSREQLPFEVVTSEGLSPLAERIAQDLLSVVPTPNCEQIARAVQVGLRVGFGDGAQQGWELAWDSLDEGPDQGQP